MFKVEKDIHCHCGDYAHYPIVTDIKDFNSLLQKVMDWVGKEYVYSLKVRLNGKEYNCEYIDWDDIQQIYIEWQYMGTPVLCIDTKKFWSKFWNEFFGRES